MRLALPQSCSSAGQGEWGSVGVRHTAVLPVGRTLSDRIVVQVLASLVFVYRIPSCAYAAASVAVVSCWHGLMCRCWRIVLLGTSSILCSFAEPLMLSNGCGCSELLPCPVLLPVLCLPWAMYYSSKHLWQAVGLSKALLMLTSNCALVLPRFCGERTRRARALRPARATGWGRGPAL